MKVNPPTPAPAPTTAKTEKKPSSSITNVGQGNAARVPSQLLLAAPAGAQLSRLLPKLLDGQSLAKLLTTLLTPDSEKAPAVLRQWLLSALAVRLRLAGQNLPRSLMTLLDSLSDDQQKLLSDGLGRLEQAQVQSRQDALFWALPLPFADDWLELSWPKPQQRRQNDAEPVLTLLFPLPGKGRLLVKASLRQVRFYADNLTLKTLVDNTLPRLTARFADLGLAVTLHSFQGKVPQRLAPASGLIDEEV